MNLKSTLFGLLVLSGLALSAQTPSIVTQVNPAAVCPGAIVTITFETSDTFVSDNIFTILLSDSSGSFANADTLDTIQSQSGSSITYTVPALPGSAHYQITVLGSDPAVIGFPATLNIKKLLPAPNLQLAYNTASLCTGDTERLTIDTLSHIQYTWYFEDTARADAHPYYFVAKKQGEYGIMFTDTTAAGCSVGFDSVFIGIYAFPPKPTVTESGPPNICGSGTVPLTAHDNDTATLTYQWTNHGDTVAGATTTTYGASSSGVYGMIVSNHGCSSYSSDSVAINIASVPVISLQLPTDSFCLYGPSAELSGGTPATGYFSGNYVVGSQFMQSESGLGSFTIYYTVVDTIGCHTTDSTTISILDCTSAITETNSAPAISLYPNPVSNIVTISIQQPGTVSLRVLNLVGQTVSTQLFEHELHYSVENLPSGTYMLEMTGPSESWCVVKKLVVE